MFLDGVCVAAAPDRPSEPYLLGSLGLVGGNVRRRRPLAFIGSPPPYRSRETGACASRRPSTSPRSPICWVPSAGRGHGRPRGAQRTVKSMRSGNDATTSRPLAVAPRVEFGVPPPSRGGRLPLRPGRTRRPAGAGGPRSSSPGSRGSPAPSATEAPPGTCRRARVGVCGRLADRHHLSTHTHSGARPRRHPPRTGRGRSTVTPSGGAHATVRERPSNGPHRSCGGPPPEDPSGGNRIAVGVAVK